MDIDLDNIVPFPPSTIILWGKEHTPKEIERIKKHNQIVTARMFTSLVQEKCYGIKKIRRRKSIIRKLARMFNLRIQFEHKGIIISFK
jgi:hypothetical protein